MLGEHAKLNEYKVKTTKYPKKKKQIFSLICDAPSFLLNNLTVTLFNKLYFYLNSTKKTTIIDWDTYFYPLDSIKNWNRIYGKKGFFQFQFVLPKKNSIKGLKKILLTVQGSTSGSFLAVLKNLGPGQGYLSFPREGITLALDFKATKKNIEVVKGLIDFVNNLNGCCYLAKDAIMSSTQFKQNFDKINFWKYRNKAIKSEQSIRLKL